MGERDRGAIVQGVERLLSRGVEPERDGELLERFQAGRDEAAFEALVTRHGPMVRGVCRRLLRDDHDADDAFQATFLVLARKGAGLRHPDRLGPWLYGVASRVAAKARVRSARRKARPLTDDIPAREEGRAEWSDVLPIVDAELARLPSSQRDVLVACLLHGSSEQEAARAFACPVGTIKSRLSRAKEALRSRLVRRGVAPSAALAAASSPGSFASPVSAPLLRATLSLVAAPATIPQSVAALTSGVAPTMLTRILAPAAALAGGLTIVGLSAVAWTADPPQAPPATQPSARASSEARVQLDRNLKTILVALKRYESANEYFPPAAIQSSDGRPLLSWRVALLPYLEQTALYEQFHLDEPWDSPHNRPLADRMPAVFETPGFPAPQAKTRIRGVDAPGAMFGPPPGSGPGMVGTGPGGMGGGGMGMMMSGTMGMPGIAKMEGAAPGPSSKSGPTAVMEGMMGVGSGEEEGAGMRGRMAGAGPDAAEPESGGQGVKSADVQDGTSNTAFLVVAEDAVEWTRPGELVVPDGLSLSGGGSLPALVEDSDGYVLGMVDGSVRRLPRQPNRREILLPALLTLAGDEIINSSILATGLGAVAPNSAAEPKAPAAFERRLRRVEEKLDEILERLDALAAPPGA